MISNSGLSVAFGYGLLYVLWFFSFRMSSRLSLAYMIDSVPFSKLLYCWRSAMNTEAASIPVASARRELSFP